MSGGKRQKSTPPAAAKGEDIAEFIRKEAEKRAARKDPKLHLNGEVPHGFGIRGVSAHYRADGSVISYWSKDGREQDPEAFLDAFRYAVLETRPKARSKILAPRRLNKDLLTVYPMGDPHLGMLSWHLETGHDFDLQIAETNLVAAVDHLVDIAPASETALIANVGDFFHSDNNAGVTARSGHHLDTDGRWAKVLVVGLRTMTRCIDRALEKHARVRVINEIGNHDDHTSIMLSVCLASHYRSNPRVEIDTSPSPFHWLEFGKVLIGVTHGLVKASELPGIMAHDQAEAWGRTLFRYFYGGHLHQTIKHHEKHGVVCETFRTMARPDAWAHSMGYRSGQSMYGIVHDREQGEILRHQVGIEALKRAA